MQAGAHSRGVVAVDVLTVRPRRKTLFVDDCLIIGINRTSVEISPVDFVADVLQKGEFRLHEVVVAAISLMAHHGAGKFGVADFGQAVFPHVYRNAADFCAVKARESFSA